MKRVLTLAMAALAASCGPIDSSGGGNEGDLFIAFGSSFTDFRTWQSFPVPEGGPTNVVHTSGKRTEYLNQAPKAKSTGALPRPAPRERRRGCAVADHEHLGEAADNAVTRRHGEAQRPRQPQNRRARQRRCDPPHSGAARGRRTSAADRRAK